LPVFGFSQDTLLTDAVQKSYQVERMEKKVQEREIFIAKYVDSLNSYENKGNCKLPYFFTSENFDQKHGAKYWVTMHSSISIRKLIIDRINNYDLLWCVKDSENPKVRIKDTSKIRCLYCKIPFDQFSTQELVEFRIDALMNKRHLYKK